MSYTLALGPSRLPGVAPNGSFYLWERERVVDCDYRDGNNERDIATRLAHLSLDQALHTVARICDTCAYAHALAFCQALESLAGIVVHERAEALRTILAELERLASHLGAVRQITDALGLQRHSSTIGGLHTLASEAMQLVSGTPASPDMCLPGGVSRDLVAEERIKLLTLLQRLNRQLYAASAAIIDQRSIVNRIADVGSLSHAAAESFGVRGRLRVPPALLSMNVWISRMRCTPFWSIKRLYKRAAMCMPA